MIIINLLAIPRTRTNLHLRKTQPNRPTRPPTASNYAS